MVTLLCGKIGCGKTVYAQKLQKETEAVILSTDELMLTVFEGCLGDDHDRTQERCLAYLFGLAAQLNTLGVSSVIDDGLWTARARQKAKAFFAERNIPCRLHLIEVSEERRQRQIAQRNIILKQSKTRVFAPSGETLRRLDAKFETPDTIEVDAIIGE